jgi:hypothetical protein
MANQIQIVKLQNLKWGNYLTEKNLILPFIVKAQNQKGDLTYPAEIATVVCLAERQRKKIGFLRDTPEKMAFISKVHYPLWVVSAENSCIVLDGLGALSYKFSFKEPTKTEIFIEELKKNSVNHEQFMDALEKQTRKLGEFTSLVNVQFNGLITDSELLSFLIEYFKRGQLLNKNEDTKDALIPMEVYEKAAFETSKAIVEYLRIIQADSKGLQYAISVLNEEAEFHKYASTVEAERLKEKCEAELSTLRPEVEKTVKKLTAKHDKNLATIQRNVERKISVLEKQRDRYMRKLQGTEQKKENVQKRMETAKHKKTSSKKVYGSYELERYEREINNTKKEIKAVNEAIEKIKKENEKTAKQVEEEFSRTVAQEEGKIKELTALYEAKTNNKKNQIVKITSQEATIKISLENVIDELKRSSATLRRQVEIEWKISDIENPVLVQVPIYLIKYVKRNEERYSLFSPISISEEVSVLDGLRKIMAFSSEPRLKTLTRPASKKLTEMFNSNVTEKMQSDEVFKSNINSLCRANNLLDTMEFAEALNQGLDELTKIGWLTSEEAAALCKQTMGEEA